MNAQNEAERIQLLQKQYFREIEAAERDRAANGEYAEEGLLSLKRAATIQGVLARMSEGVTRQHHIAESMRLIREVEEISRRLGVPAQEAPEQPQSAPAPRQAPSAGPAPAPKRGKKDEEVGSFSPEESILKPSSVRFDDVLGKEKEIRLLRQAIDFHKFPEKFPGMDKQALDIPQPGFLFYGPPGTGKTHLCKAISSYVYDVYGDRGAFFNVSCEELGSKYVGVAEKRIGMLFDAVQKYDFAVICLDEIQRIASSRDSDERGGNYADAFLQNIDGIAGQTRAMVIGCTNFPWKVDKALLNRLTNLVFLDYPSEEEAALFLRARLERTGILGSEPRQTEAIIDRMAKEAVRRHFSYRNLERGLYSQLLFRSIEKTLKEYPEGNPLLTQFSALPPAEIEQIMAGISAPFDAETYERYVHYAKEAAGG